MEDWRAIVGRNVRQLRLAKGLTQEQLAVDARIDLTYIGGIERAKRNPTVLILARISEVLEVEPGRLLERHPRTLEVGGQGRGL